MESNGIGNGLVNGRFDNSLVGLANGRIGSEQMISEANTFIFTIKTTSTRTLDLPLVVGGTYNFWIDWGDGKKDYITTYNQTNTTHTYPTALKEYTVKITGICKGWSYNGLSTEAAKLTSIKRWGCLEMIDDLLGNQFNQCSNCDFFNVLDNLNLGNLSYFRATFSSCGTINIGLINNWNVSKVTNIGFLFQNDSIFNQPLNNWNTSNITDMAATFNVCNSFNQPLDNWDTSSCINMSSMFLNAIKFDQDINVWDVSKVINMNNMFGSASAFNEPLYGWNTSACTNMQSMFSNAIVFNQNINNWDVSKVTIMQSMFNVASAFNQPLSGWNVSACTNMVNMFNLATSFDQNIGNWNVSQVTIFTGFMANKTPATFSTTNLDAIYNGWIKNELQKSMSITFGTAKYSSGGTSVSTESRALLSRTSVVDLTITGFTNNGGLVRIGVSGATGLNTNNKIFIKNVNPSYVNGLWSITIATTTTFDLQGSTFGASYVSGGTLIRTYAWTITDGGPV